MQIYVNNVSELDSGRAFAPAKLSALRPGRRLRRNSKVRQSLPCRLAALAIPSGADGPTPIWLGNLKEPDTRYRGFSRSIKG
jgi:hypothetical protein